MFQKSIRSLCAFGQIILIYISVKDTEEKYLEVNRMWILLKRCSLLRIKIVSFNPSKVTLFIVQGCNPNEITDLDSD